MRIFWDVLVGVNVLAAVVGIAAVVKLVCEGMRPFLRGRYISRPLIRRIGEPLTLVLRSVSVFAVFPGGLYLGGLHSLLVVALASNLWWIDDGFFSSDEPKRKHEWGRVKLRMPKPVKLRAVERWKPVAA